MPFIFKTTKLSCPLLDNLVANKHVVLNCARHVQYDSYLMVYPLVKYALDFYVAINILKR